MSQGKGKAGDRINSVPGIAGPADERFCRVCGRRITWRKKWQHNWDEITLCSSACRKQGTGAIDKDIEEAIVNLLDSRAGGATICPSEVARRVFGADESVWRPEMERVRMAARRLVNDDRLEIVQKGQLVDASTARGPIRLRLLR